MARAIYRRPPDAAELAWLGLTPDDYAAEAGLPPVWPENLTTAEVFAALATQWNSGMAGPTGLRYEVLPTVLRMLGVARAEQRDVFAGLRVMERAALVAMREQ